MDSLPALTVGMIRILQKKTPLPASIRADTIHERMFSSHAESAVYNALIYYLICIADQQLGKTIPWPIGTHSVAKFNQSIIKALREISKDEELFQLSNTLSIGSILKEKKGSKFERLMFELARNALRITNVREGSRAVPNINSDFPACDRIEEMRAIEAKLNLSLDEKRNEIPIVEEQEERLLRELNQTKTAINTRFAEIVQNCPPAYKEQMNVNGLMAMERNKAVVDKWHTDLDTVLREQENKKILVSSYNQHVDAITSSTRGSLTGVSLINKQNAPLVAKTAYENNIELHQGASVLLSGFMKTSCTISEKLVNVLIANREKQKLPGNFEEPLERSQVLLAEMNNRMAELEQACESTKEHCKQSRQLYEEKIAAEGGHRYQLPDQGGEIRVDTPPAPYDPANLILSPGTQSPKRVLEEARRRRREADSGSSNGVDTPKSSEPNRSRTGNSSMSQLTKSVLQKQTLSISQATSTICGEPLGASSPVHWPISGGAQEPTGAAAQTRPDTSSLANILNDLEETDLDFFDLSEGSENMDSTFGSPEPQHLQRNGVDPFRSRLPVPMSLRNLGTRENPLPSTDSNDTKDGLAVPLPDSNLPAASVNPVEHCSASTRRPSTAPAASPARLPRRSIQDIIERYQKIKSRRQK